MASKKPVVRQVAWLSIFPQLLFMGILLTFFGLTVRPFNLALLLAMLTYLIISFTLRFTIPHNHRKGILFFRAGKFEPAIDEFQKSYDFFTKHKWIDRYRYITLLSSSRISYLEMALMNIAVCCAQSGDGKTSKQY